MPSTPTFARLSIEQFPALQARFDFRRVISSVDVHHTWRPRRRDFRGHETIVAMWRYHTQTNGWRDIGQHLTVDPEGFIWLGRNWNLPPCSAPNGNGNGQRGPMMIEVIGDFDKGQDVLEGPQRTTLIRLIAAIDHFHGLASGTLRFHRDMVGYKSCPGTGVDKDLMMGEVEAALRNLQKAAPARAFVPDSELEPMLRTLERAVPDQDDPPEAEPAEDEGQRRGLDDAATLGARGFDGGEAGAEGLGASASGAGGSGLGPATLAALKPYLVNLSCGRLSTGGEVQTTDADLDRLFGVDLPAAARAAAAEGKPLHVLLYAHGGLVGEADGLRVANKHVEWWKAQQRVNGAFIRPLYFTWETGFFEILRQQILGNKPRGVGEWFDGRIEELCRHLGPRHVWTGMKTNAQRGVDEPEQGDPGGAAREVARRLAEFHQAQQAAGHAVDYHAVGHSAGSIFHAWLLPVAHGLGLPAVKSLHLLAPAARTELFRERLLQGDALSPCIEDLTIYTMAREYELRDTVGPYRKSLLYLIHHALEDQDGAPVLGLEESIKGDPVLARALGVAQPAANARVIWSRSDAQSGRDASMSVTHGGFDDDAATMESVLRRVLGLGDADPIAPFPQVQRREGGGASRGFGPTEPGMTTPPTRKAGAPSVVVPPPETRDLGAGRRVALCVGIDQYSRPEHQLQGCVADARAWSDALTRMGFQTSTLLDAQATRAAMLGAVGSMIRGAQVGDVLVWHYSGHGTQVPDLDGDETDAEGRPGQDQALVPFDYESGQLLLDDDLRELFSGLPDGVNLTVFMDCCHSYSNTRAFVAGPPPKRPEGAKPRSFTSDQALIEAHAKAWRADPARAQASRALGRGAAVPPRPVVKFSACKDSEEALELNGQGQFTVRALRVLEAGVAGMSNTAFRDALVKAFGEAPLQHPGLDVHALAGLEGMLLQPLGAASTATEVPDKSGHGGARARDDLAGEGGRGAAGSDAWTAVGALARAVEALAAKA